MFFVIIEISDINITIRINLNAMALLYIIVEASFIDLSLLIYENSISYFFVVLIYTSKIYFIQVFNQSDLICSLMQHSIQIYSTMAHWLKIFDKEIAELFLIFFKHVSDFVLLLTNLDPENFVVEHRGLRTLNSVMGLLFEYSMLSIFSTAPFPVFLHNFIHYIIY